MPVALPGQPSPCPPREPRGRLPPQRGPGRPRHRATSATSARSTPTSRSSCTSRPARAIRRTTRRPEWIDRYARSASTAGGTPGGTRRSPANSSSGFCPPAPSCHHARRGCRRGTTSTREDQTGGRPVHGVLRRLPVPRRRPDRPGARLHRRARRARQHLGRSPCPTTAPAPREAPTARSTTPGCGTAIRPGRRELRERVGRARRHRRLTTTTRGAGRWRATRRSGDGSVRCTRVASPIPASCSGRPASHSRGEIRHQFAHAIDVLPTILELVGLEAPEEINGLAQSPIDGTSFAYLLDDADAPERHTTQYFEMLGSRGIYHRRMEGGDVQASRPRCTATASTPTRRSRTTGGSCTTWPRTSPSATTWRTSGPTRCRR